MSIMGKMTGYGGPQPDWAQTDSARADFIKNKPDVEALRTAAEGALPKSGGTMTGPIHMDGSKITGLGSAGADTDALSRASGDGRYQMKTKTASVTLTAAGWSGNAQTVAVTGVTASNSVVVSPAPGSFLTYGENQVRCTGQGAGSLTFSCEGTPGTALTVNVLILD